jgi:LmbE family N-acetylglucosaminyl deacetylase
LKKPVTDAQMKKIRFRELQKAGKILHLKKIWVLGLPNGQLDKKTNELFQKIFPLAKRIRPEAILSFGPDGVSGHLEHIAIGQVAKKISKHLNLPFYTFTLSPKVTTSALKFLKTRRKFGNYAKKIIYQKPNIKINISPSIKSKAIRAHLSQMNNQKAFTGFPTFAVKELLKAEYFIKTKT